MVWRKCSLVEKDAVFPKLHSQSAGCFIYLYLSIHPSIHPSIFFWPPRGIWRSQARDQIPATVVTYAAAVAMSDPWPPVWGWGSNPHPESASQHCRDAADPFVPQRELLAVLFTQRRTHRALECLLHWFFLHVLPHSSACLSYENILTFLSFYLSSIHLYFKSFISFTQLWATTNTSFRSMLRFTKQNGMFSLLESALSCSTHIDLIPAF